MGMCKPSGGKISQIGHIGSLKKEGAPNTRIDLFNEQGELIQQRWYGADGRAVLNRDWSHGGVRHTFPHDHIWDWTTDMEHPDRPPYTDKNGNKINQNYC